MSVVLGYGAADRVTRRYAGRWVRRQSCSGHYYQDWVPDVPRISNALLECVVYLYPDAAAAHQGKSAGGTGFLLGVPGSNADREHPDDGGDEPLAFQGVAHLYAVTAKHVITGIGSTVRPAPVIRYHRKDGAPEVIPMRAENWREHPAGDDLAICPLGLTTDYAPALYVRPRELVDACAMQRHYFGIGNSVYVVGRYIGHDGVLRNKPTVRFGNVAMMEEPVYNTATNRDQVSILIDIRMREGYSGSPVFVIQFAQERPYAPTPPPPVVTMLLGVLWGFLYEPTPLRGKGRTKPRNNRRPLPDYVVEQNAGLAGIVPAWKINDLLEMEELTVARQEAERALEERAESSHAMPAAVDAAASSSKKISASCIMVLPHRIELTATPATV